MEITIPKPNKKQIVVGSVVGLGEDESSLLRL
jgi:hypothetical protein